MKKLASELNCNNKLYYKERETNFGHGKTVRFETCNSKQMFDDLSRFGIVSNIADNSDNFKNLEELVPNYLIKHFIRGLLDGDGTITDISKINSRGMAFYQNNMNFCIEVDKLIKKYIDNNIYSNYQTLNNKNIMYLVRYRRIEDMKKILTELYKGANIYLKRKYEIAQQYFKDVA